MINRDGSQSPVKLFGLLLQESGDFVSHANWRDRGYRSGALFLWQQEMLDASFYIWRQFSQCVVVYPNALPSRLQTKQPRFYGPDFG